MEATLQTPALVAAKNTPNGNLPDTTGNNANQNNGNGSLTGRTDVGSYVLTTSPSGAYDMAGNVYELTDTIYNNQSFALLGGAYPGNVGFPSTGAITTSGGGSPIMGFRIADIAAVPEAGAALLLSPIVLIGLALKAARRKASLK